MPSVDVLKFVERTIAGLCGFFLSIIYSVALLVWNPKTTPAELSSNLDDEKIQQVGPLTLIFIIFAPPAFWFLAAFGPSRVSIFSDEYLVHTFKGDMDWIAITTIVFALVVTGILDFTARLIAWLMGNNFSTAHGGQTRFAIFVPLLVMTLLSIVIAVGFVWIKNNTQWSDILIAVVVAILAAICLKLMWMALNACLGAELVSRGWFACVVAVFIVGYFTSIFVGFGAALVAARGLNSESLAEADVLHVLSPLCFLGSDHKPHLSAAIVNSGKAVAAVKSRAYVGLNGPHLDWPFGESLGGFWATTGDKDKQPGGIIMIKGGDAAAVDFVADADAPDMSNLSNKANLCVLNWTLYGASSPRPVIAKLQRD